MERVGGGAHDNKVAVGALWLISRTLMAMINGKRQIEASYGIKLLAGHSSLNLFISVTEF